MALWLDRGRAGLWDIVRENRLTAHRGQQNKISETAETVWHRRGSVAVSLIVAAPL
jgi:hypothetical protein